MPEPELCLLFLRPLNLDMLNVSGYDANSSCQFSGSAFGQTIFFGSGGCVGVRNDATGLCSGTCN